MLLFYIRHGEPIYDPDSLTPAGHRQAEAAARRLARYGVDRIFASTSNRAKQTAQPLCDMLKKEMTLLDFCNEQHAYEEFTVKLPDGRPTWLFYDPNEDTRRILASPEVEKLGNSWYEYPGLPKGNFKAGTERVNRETDAFLEMLGYRHNRAEHIYEIVEPSDEHVALFAHQGFGLAFLSSVLDIPYPMVALHMDMTYTGITVIDFPGKSGYTVPKMLMLSNDSHLYAENILMPYNHALLF